MSSADQLYSDHDKNNQGKSAQVRSRLSQARSDVGQGKQMPRHLILMPEVFFILAES